MLDIQQKQKKDQKIKKDDYKNQSLGLKPYNELERKNNALTTSKFSDVIFLTNK